MNGVEAQHLTIRILSQLSVDEIMSILGELRKKDISEAVEEQLRLCIGISRELREEPGRYDTLEQVCKSILLRSIKDGKSIILKKEYWKALGLNNAMHLNRIERGIACLRVENIEKICSMFVSEYRRRFWENQLLYLYPDITAPGRECETEDLCLMTVYKALNEKQQNFINSQLNLSEGNYMEELREKMEEENSKKVVRKEDGLGDPPYKLYKIINKQAEKCHMTIPEIAEEIGISVNTWYSWKKSWEETEEKNFAEGVPHFRFSRVDLMILAVLFQFTYRNTVTFMALMGYRLIEEEPDCYLLSYLTGKEKRKAEEVKQYLQRGKVSGKWGD